MSINAGTAIGYLDLDTSKFKSALKDAQKQLSSFSDKSLNAGQKFTNMGQGLKTIGSTLSKAVTLPLLAMGTAASKSAIDFESAFAGVKKTVDATDKELSKLEQGIRKLSKEMPTAATEIAGVAEAAGQLGIKTSNILDFTKTMVMLGDSTNMSAEEAATSLARLANITGMSQKDFDKLGSTIVALGNNLATTEAEITEMGLRLAGAGSQVGMSEAQILSFAGALSSVGINAEAGGSAFSKVMVNMQLATETGGEKLKQFASVAGMSASEFKKAFQEDAASAIIAFLKGLGDAESKGKSAISILDEMGIKEVVLRDALLRAAGASDVFSDAINLGTEAWQENTALTNEASQRYETMASRISILKNKFIDIGITVGNILLPYVEKLVNWLGEAADWFSQLDSSIQGTIVVIGAIAAAIGPVLIIIGQMSIGIGALIGFLGKAKLAFVTFGAILKTNLIAHLISFNMFLSTTIMPALTAFATFISGTIIPILTTTAITIGAVTVPVWAVIAAIAALIAMGVLLYKNWDEIKAKCSEVWNTIVETVTTAWNNIKTYTTEVWNNIKSIIQPAVDFVKDIISSAWNFISTTTSTIWNSIKGIIQSVWELIKSIIELDIAVIQLVVTVAWNAIKTVTTTVWNAIKSVIQTVWSAISPIVTAGVNAVKSVVTTVWNTIKSVTTTVWNAIKTVVTSGVNSVKSIITTVFNAVKSVVTTIWNSIKTVIQTAWNGIKSVVSTGANLIKSTISSVFSTLTNIMTAPFRAAQSVISGILGGITSAINKVTSSINKVTSMIKTVEAPTPAQEYLDTYNDNDYSKARFNYAKAKQTTISDVIATNYSMIEGLKDFAKGIKVDNTKANVSTENSINISLNIDRFINETSQSIDDLMDEIAFRLKRKSIF